MTKSGKLPAISRIERVISLSSSAWQGRCYEVACAIVNSRIIKGQAIYGHYYGPVANIGYWAGRKDFIFQRHGWIVKKDGTIIDPTRWSFENVKPYLASIPKDSKKYGEYDRAGNRFRQCMQSPPPIYNPIDRLALLRISDTKIENFLFKLLGWPPAITVKMIFWIANLIPSKLGQFAKRIYQILDKNNYGAFIPIDNRHLILGQENLKRKEEKK